MPYKFLRIAVVLIGGLAMLSAGPGIGLAEAQQSIYDPRLEQRLEVTAQQRPQVHRIIQEHKRMSMAVFRKYGIDPYGRPIFNQLVDASDELMAIARQERQMLREILTPEQLAQYDRIIDDTRIRVRAAAQ
jgi:Spy/CpxP family protein refolding chaperone